MMYDELIKRLRETPSIPVDAKLHNEAADAIEDLENRLNLWRQDKIRRWIPVTERLPELHKIVLVADKANDIGMGTLEPLWDGTVWVVPFEDVDNEFRPISHWMPLPKPPKEE